MTLVTPTFQTVAQPTQKEVMDSHERQIQKSINCVRIGIIQSFNAENQTAEVLIAQQQVTSIAQDGTRTLAQYPPILVVPVLFPSGGGFTLTFPVEQGDECLLLFNDRELDNWLLSGAGLPPTTSRVHDLSDAIAIVGLRSYPRSLSGLSTTAVQLRSDDQQTYIEVGPGKIQLVADEVVIHGRNKTTFDAGGTGFVYQPAVIDTYTDGVTSNHHPPTPPEVPT